VHAVLRSIDSADIGSDTIDSYQPSNPKSFCLWVTATCGPSDGPGGELFQVAICSPEGLVASIEDTPNKGFAFMRHRLVVERWDASLIRRAINDLCRTSTGDTWHDVALRLGRYMLWEFEDYRP